MPTLQEIINKNKKLEEKEKPKPKAEKIRCGYCEKSYVDIEKHHLKCPKNPANIKLISKHNEMETTGESTELLVKIGKTEMPEYAEIAWSNLERGIKSAFKANKWKSMYDHYKIFKGWLEKLGE